MNSTGDSKRIDFQVIMETLAAAENVTTHGGQQCAGDLILVKSGLNRHTDVGSTRCIALGNKLERDDARIIREAITIDVIFDRDRVAEADTGTPDARVDFNDQRLAKLQHIAAIKFERHHFIADHFQAISVGDVKSGAGVVCVGGLFVSIRK